MQIVYKRIKFSKTNQNDAYSTFQFYEQFIIIKWTDRLCKVVKLSMHTQFTYITKPV